MRIDDLVANLERNAKKQNEIMTQQLMNVTSQHLASYNELLQSNLKATQRILDEQQQIIKANETTLSQQIAKISKHKLWVGGAIGFLGAMVLGLFLVMVFMGYKINQQRDELAKIQQHLQQAPLEAKILSKVRLKESNGYYYITSSHKNAKAYTSQNQSQVLRIPSK